jgi:hypothetical protein
MARSRLTKVSKAVFTSESRLAVLHAIATADPSEIYATRISELAKVGSGQASQELRKLSDSDVGLLIPPEGDSNSKRVVYLRTESVFWRLVVDFFEELS